jgi:hypothetical protein
MKKGPRKEKPAQCGAGRDTSTPLVIVSYSKIDVKGNIENYMVGGVGNARGDYCGSDCGGAAGALEDGW